MRRIATRQRTAQYAALGLIAGTLLCGCDASRTVLSDAGTESAQVTRLFWILLCGAVPIWLATVSLALLAARRRGDAPDASTPHARWMIVGGGLVLPTVLLGVLVSGALWLLADLLRTDHTLTVRVTGERFWWRVTYEHDGQPVELANEVRLPAGQRTRLILDAPDVIHSFWVPALGGKTDMIPGRSTTRYLEPTRPGRYHGVCTEYCGTAHANMAFAVQVMKPAEFSDWLAAQAQPAAPAAAAAAANIPAGAAVFSEEGCGACHTIRGTPHDGRIGPDLTHLASRHTVGAMERALTADNLSRWITHTHVVKPGVEMPAYPHLSGPDGAALVDYLMSLK